MASNASRAVVAAITSCSGASSSRSVFAIGGSSSTTSTRARLALARRRAPRSPGAVLARSRVSVVGQRRRGTSSPRRARCRPRCSRRATSRCRGRSRGRAPSRRRRGLVVKNGSKMRGRTSAGMPSPLSDDLEHRALVAVGAHRDADLVVRRARLGHRLRRVEQQVEDDLLEPRLVRPDRRATGSNDVTTRARWRSSWPAILMADRTTRGEVDAASASRRRRARSCGARARWSTRARRPCRASCEHRGQARRGSPGPAPTFGSLRAIHSRLSIR